MTGLRWLRKDPSRHTLAAREVVADEVPSVRRQSETQSLQVLGVDWHAGDASKSRQRATRCGTVR